MKKLLISLLLVFWMVGTAHAAQKPKGFWSRIGRLCYAQSSEMQPEQVETIEISDHELYDPAEDPSIQPLRISERERRVADEEDKKEQGIVPIGDPLLAHDEQVQEIVTAIKKQIALDTNEQERRATINEGLSWHDLGSVPPLLDLIARGAKPDWLDENVHIKKIEVDGASQKIAVSHDGQYILTDVNLRGWRLLSKDGAVLHESKDRTVVSIAISDDGSFIVIGSYDGKPLEIWDRNEGKFYGLGVNRVRSVAINSNDQTIVTIDPADLVQTWSREGRPIKQFHGNGPTNVAISGDGSIIVIHEAGVIHLFDGEGNALSSYMVPSGGNVGISRDGGVLTVGANIVLFGKVQSALLIDRANQKDPVALADSAAAAINGDGDLIVTGSSNGAVALWNRDGQKLREFAGPPGISNIAISSDGTLIVISTHKKTMIWSIGE